MEIIVSNNKEVDCFSILDSFCNTLIILEFMGGYQSYEQLKDKRRTKVSISLNKKSFDAFVLDLTNNGIKKSSIENILYRDFIFSIIQNEE